MLLKCNFATRKQPFGLVEEEFLLSDTEWAVRVSNVDNLDNSPIRTVAYDLISKSSESI